MSNSADIIHLNSEEGSVGAAYQALIADEVLQPDHQQAKCVAALDQVRAGIDAPEQKPSFFFQTRWSQ